MTTLQTNPDGSLLSLGGHLIADNECCCDESSCPQCPPLEDMPPFCEFVLDTPLGELHMHYPGSDPDLIPTWRRMTADDNDVSEPEGSDYSTQCWYGLDVPFEAEECIGYCEDKVEEFPLVDEDGILSCRYSEPCCIDDPPPGEGEECQEFAPGWQYDILEGVVKFGMRELISLGQGVIQYRMNCDDGKKYQKLRYCYNFDQQLKGRFIGDHTVKRVLQSDENEVCYLADPIEHNKDTIHVCDECPQFQRMPNEETDTGHNWTYPQSNVLDFSLLIEEVEVGLYYPTNFGVKYVEDEWIEISDFFASQTTLPKGGCAECYPWSENGTTSCSQINETVAIGGICQYITWNPSITNWEYWECNPNFRDGVSPDQDERWVGTAAFPPVGLFDIDIDFTATDCAEPTPDDICASPPTEDDGLDFVEHLVSWNSSAPADCTYTQPDAATACTPP